MSRRHFTLKTIFNTPRHILRQNVLDEAALQSGQRLPLRTRLISGGYLIYMTLVESDFLTRAAAISYSFVFSLIPLFTTTLAFFTAFPGLSVERERLTKLLFSQLLPGAVQSVQSYIERFSQRATAAGAVSSLAFLVTTLLVFQTLESCFNNIWKVERGRTWSRRLQSLAVFFVVGAIAAATLVVLDQKTQQLGEHVKGAELLKIRAALEQYSLEVIGIFIAWTIFVIANKILPNAKVYWRPALIGGVVAGTVWHFLKAGFNWYITQYPSYQNIYGTLAAIPIFFLWIYLSAALLLASGYISFVIQNFAAVALTRKTRHGSYARAFYGVSVAATLARAFRNQEGQLTAQEIARRLSIAPYFVTEALDELCVSNTVLETESETAEPSFILAKPSDQISVYNIIKQVSDEELKLPQVKEASPLHQRIENLFNEAKRKEASTLETITIADIEREAPLTHRTDQKWVGSA